MQVSVMYPKIAKKLYHRKPGQLIQICRNDFEVDNNFYLVTGVQVEKSIGIVNVRNGEYISQSVSTRTIAFDKAIIVPEGHDEC